MSSPSVVTLSPPSSSIDRKTITYYFDVLVGAGDYAANGLACSFAGFVRAPGAPLWVEIESQASPNSRYVYVYNPGAGTSPVTPATQTSGKLQILTGAAAQSPLTEQANGATPAAVVADTIVMRATFLRG